MLIVSAYVLEWERNSLVSLNNSLCKVTFQNGQEQTATVGVVTVLRVSGRKTTSNAARSACDHLSAVRYFVNSR